MIRRILIVAAIAVGLLAGGSLSVGSAASVSLTSQKLTPYRTCTLTATPATTTVVADSTVRQGSASANFGTLASITVSSANGANQRVYLKFSLTSCSPAIPASAIVRLATLRLYVTAIAAGCRTLDIYPATVAWTEAAITWNDQPFGTTINNPATGSRTGTFDVGTAGSCQNQGTGAYVTGATVTSNVASFVSGGSTNLGWMIRDDTEGSGTTRTTTFAAKDLGTVAQAPQLVITYVVVP